MKKLIIYKGDDTRFSNGALVAEIETTLESLVGYSLTIIIEKSIVRKFLGPIPETRKIEFQLTKDDLTQISEGFHNVIAIATDSAGIRTQIQTDTLLDVRRYYEN